MNAFTEHELTLIMHNQHIFKAVEVAEYLGVKQWDQDVENAVRVLLYLSPDYPECVVTVDNLSRVMMLMHGTPTLAELILIDKYIMEAGLEIGGRRLRMVDVNPVYTVHCEGFTIHLAGSGPGFGFPLEVTLIAWTDMDDIESHHEECPYAIGDEDLGDCNCESQVDWRRHHVMAASNWEKILPKFLDDRYDAPSELYSSIWTQDNSGPIIGGRIFD